MTAPSFDAGFDGVDLVDGPVFGLDLDLDFIITLPLGLSAFW
jgi:hypothetical protein